MDRDFVTELSQHVFKSEGHTWTGNSSSELEYIELFNGMPIDSCLPRLAQTMAEYLLCFILEIILYISNPSTTQTLTTLRNNIRLIGKMLFHVNRRVRKRVASRYYNAGRRASPEGAGHFGCGCLQGCSGRDSESDAR
ncbi:hypothetical protein BJ508DRAFT_21393 [Ascobolus immersus RN42]|uniref:Uncharacterized protein n=1 Tax=Ascobolus immersus RN42 TaxID=1160509 RepID=A0A3N4HNJ8_ASCIM|nr:hypothetical protein BJ508DRAFT_21393 [Ascobolus immersus RN42]